LITLDLFRPDRAVPTESFDLGARLSQRGDGVVGSVGLVRTLTVDLNTDDHGTHDADGDQHDR
jgi:hypothetical protein